MRIHYFQHVPFEGLGSIATWTIDRGCVLSATKFYQNEPLPALQDFDWLVVMGGPMNIYEEDKYPWLKEEKKSIELAITGNKTVLGICLGAQLIADVLGARVYQGEHKEIGWFPIESAASSNIWQGIPPRMTVFHWHGDTFDTPPGANRLAFSEGCPNQAFSYRERVLGLQFHLESTPESVQQIISNCGDELVPGKYIQTADEILSKPDRFRQINEIMGQILTNLCV